MTEILRPGRVIAAEAVWWLLVQHVCPYCECAYRLLAGDGVSHYHDTVRDGADSSGVTRIASVPYVQSACPCCGRAVATKQPIRFSGPAVSVHVGHV